MRWINVSPVDTWTHKESLIFIERMTIEERLRSSVDPSGASNLHHNSIASSDRRDFSRLEIRCGRSRSIGIGSIAWTVAIFRDRRRCVNTLRPCDLHQMAKIFISPGRCVGLSGAPDLYRTAAKTQDSRSCPDRLAIGADLLGN